MRRYLSLGICIIALLQAINLLVFHRSSVEIIGSDLRPSPSSMNENRRPSDGSFNNIPIYLKTHSSSNQNFHSTAHCIGETHHEETAWMYRSCKFHNLCFDTATKDFYVIKSSVEDAYQQRRVHGSFVSTSLNNNSLALGGINPRWQGKDFNQGIYKVKWFPIILDSPPHSYYTMPDDVVLVPFHSFAAHNVGHLLWDDFYALYLLLGNFGFLGDKKVLMRVDTLPLLYGTCEVRRKKSQRCAQNFERFLPLMGVDPQTFSTAKKASLQGKDSSTTMVCAKTAVAGLGMLTDHGLNDHGWHPSSEQHVQNAGKGALFFQFRNFMLRNLGLPLTIPKEGMIRVVLSAHSSGEPDRDVDFAFQYAALKQAFPSIDLRIVELAKLSIKEQVELVSQTHIFASTCGGGSMTATFLPRGASLVLFYSEAGGFEFSTFNLTGGPAYLDWDLFNNAGHLRTHWLPIGSMNNQKGLQALEYLIRHEMDVITNGI